MNHQEEEKSDIIVICGPTGIGKTAAAMTLASRFKGEIVSADSMQIYRFMDIGTAKPTADETSRVPHHMIDIIDPDVPFDAARFAEMAHGCLRGLQRRGVLPFVAGGTGFYIRALIHGLCAASPPPPALRRRLRKEARQSGGAALHEALIRLDPEAARSIHPNDTYRITRALEVVLTTGQPLSALQAAHGFGASHFRYLKIGLLMERELLYERINRRVDAMMAAGFEREVQSLLDRGFTASLKSMQSIGYRHLVDYLEGRLTRETAVATMKRDTRRYAKRQMTWFMRDPEIHWIRPDDIEAMSDRISRFMAAAS
jgi:tRNA dimethylallyltransferase